MADTDAPIDSKAKSAAGVADWWSRADDTPAAASLLTAALLKRQVCLRFMKRVLPIGGLVILAIVLLWPAVLPSLPTTAWKNGSELAMFDLTYRGTSEKGQPFSVTADKATRSAPLGVKPAPGAPPPVIGLTTPRAQLLNADGTTMEIAAQNGAYDETSEGLNLHGAVQVENGKGTRLDAPQLSVDFKQNRAWTDQPVKASGNFGTVEGQGLKLEDGGKTIIFTGQTHATLNPNHESPVEDKAEPAASPSPNTPIQP